MTMSKASVSSTLQCGVTPSLPRPTVTSTAPREWTARPSPTLMATVLVFRILACFSSLRATIGKRGARVQDRLVNMITSFHSDPDNQILYL